MSGTPEDGRAQVGLSWQPVHPSVSHALRIHSADPGTTQELGCWAHRDVGPWAGPVGKGLAEQLGPASRGCEPQALPTLSGFLLDQYFPLGPTDWLWKLLSTLQGKLFVQTAGPGLGWRQGGESSYLPVPFPPPPLGLSQREGTPVGDRVGLHRVGTNSEAAVGGGRGRGRSTSWGLMLSLSGTRFSSSRHTRPRGPGHHTETLHSLPGRSQQPRLPRHPEGQPWGGATAWQKAPPRPSPQPPFQVLLRGHLLGPPEGTKQHFPSP